MDTLRAGYPAGALLFWLATACSAPAQWLPQSPALFEDQAMKGSLTAFDNPSLPYAYHGTWADRLKNCYAVSDRGRQMTLSASAIGFDRLVKVEGYSDHPGVLATVRTEDGETTGFFLDISADHNTISVTQAGSDVTDVFVRCPDPPATAKPGGITERTG